MLYYLHSNEFIQCAEPAGSSQTHNEQQQQHVNTAAQNKILQTQRIHIYKYIGFTLAHKMVSKLKRDRVSS